ncbi:HAD family hydrolase [Paenibacillus wynnii]|uniref:HAD family hydrolase n=1 Tax=Paenibacillus wynnii TaxID=268407 RepID=A0A098M8V3_9BACL|nr:HAD family hydrolase [Paenibacillus wynnii]KGE18985.1 hypothetical protein PWYN_06185 [Paenibacillus wynnii]
MQKTTKLAIFFDLDDTLYNHLVPFRDGVREVLGLTENAVNIADLFHRVRHHSDLLWPKYLQGELELEETRLLRMELAFAEFGLDLNREMAAEVQAAYIDRQYKIKLIDGVLPQLQRFISGGHTVGIITNGPEDHQMKKIRALGVDKLIPEDRIFISDAVGIAKPDPEIFAYVNRKTETTPEHCLYIGDTWGNDVVGALEAGWKVCWYNPRDRQPLTDHVPSYTFTTYDEFKELPIL